MFVVLTVPRVVPTFLRSEKGSRTRVLAPRTTLFFILDDDDDDEEEEEEEEIADAFRESVEE